MRKHRFKQWWQILNENGHTIEQFLSERQADDYIENCPPQCPVLTMVNQRKGRVVSSIDIYP